MAKRIDIELDESWVCNQLNDVTNIETKKVAWVLVQEPGFIGFGVVSPIEICWPPYLNKLDWELVSDLRLFGEKGEWHVWRDWDGKHYARLLELHKFNDDNSITERHFLWGTKKVESDNPPWIKLTEDRGAEIWLPLETSQLKDEKKDLPLRLEIKQRIDYDSQYHLAGIVDAALVALVTATSCKPLLPTCP